MLVAELASERTRWVGLAQFQSILPLNFLLDLL